MSKSWGQVFPVDTLLWNGSRDSLINLVILADGYRAEEMSKFASDSRMITEYLFDIEPYNAYMSFFNVLAIQVESEESGVIHPQIIDERACEEVPVLAPNNYFGSALDAFGVHRLVVPKRMDLVYRVLADNVPDYQIAVVLVNSPHYGGAGGAIATLTANGSANEVFVHEIGHSFAYLCDEYSVAGSTSRESPNCTQATTRNNIYWKAWIDPETPLPTPPTEAYQEGVVGLFEGAAYQPTGWFRPQYDCKMRSLNVPFCAVCRERITHVIQELTPAIIYSDPPVDTIWLQRLDSVRFHVKTLTPDPNTLDYHWLIDNVKVESETGPDFVFQPTGSGITRVRFGVADFTPWDRLPGHLFEQSEIRTWYIMYPTTRTEALTTLNWGANPCDDLLSGELLLGRPSPVRLLLYDVNGRLVHQEAHHWEPGVQQVELPVGHLPNGVYVLSIDGPEVSWRHRVLVLHP